MHVDFSWASHFRICSKVPSEDRAVYEEYEDALQQAVSARRARAEADKSSDIAADAQADADTAGNTSIKHSFDLILEASRRVDNIKKKKARSSMAENQQAKEIANSTGSNSRQKKRKTSFLGGSVSDETNPVEFTFSSPDGTNRPRLRPSQSSEDDQNIFFNQGAANVPNQPDFLGQVPFPFMGGQQVLDMRSFSQGLELGLKIGASLGSMPLSFPPGQGFANACLDAIARNNADQLLSMASMPTSYSVPSMLTSGVPYSSMPTLSAAAPTAYPFGDSSSQSSLSLLLSGLTANYNFFPHPTSSAPSVPCAPSRSGLSYSSQNDAQSDISYNKM